MKDIAQAVGVAAGLCYHYFPNKQALYETAISQYAEVCSRGFIEVFQQTDLPLEACLNQLWQVWQQAETTGAYTYAVFFIKKEMSFSRTAGYGDGKKSISLCGKVSEGITG